MYNIRFSWRIYIYIFCWDGWLSPEARYWSREDGRMDGGKGRERGGGSLWRSVYGGGCETGWRCWCARARRTGGSWPGWSRATSSSPGSSVSCSSPLVLPPSRAGATTTISMTRASMKSLICKTIRRWLH